MSTFNSELVKTILDKCKNLSLKNQVTRRDGRFLADKSYGFDTMFFVARYIQYFRFGNLFTRDNREREEEYIIDLFTLQQGSAQVPNYFTEGLALLRFCGAVEPTKDGYKILDDEILEILSASFEHSYIFLYLLTYSVLHNDGLWPVYEQFVKANDSSKQHAYNKFLYKYWQVDPRIQNPDAPNNKWKFFPPKYSMIVLNFANQERMISRTGKVQESIVTIQDISLNTEGTRSNFFIPKKNSYLEDFSRSYVNATLRPYLINKPSEEPISYSDTISIDIADTRLSVIAQKYGIKVKPRTSQSRYKMSNGQRVRTVQGAFRNGLFELTPAKCPICGFTYRDFLIASHIKPYALCDDTYDAMNPNNGLLMCPICDKLFEAAGLMTIDKSSGEVLLSPTIMEEKDFRHLHGKVVDSRYIECERRHYLDWHNATFHSKNKI